MDEFVAALKAREFVANVQSTAVPVNVNLYAEAVCATWRTDKTLPPQVAGYSTKLGDKTIIVTNENDTDERQRFTTCHEIGHIVLAIPTQHSNSDDLFSYTRRPLNEIWCDVFAAELLLPHKIFKTRISKCASEFEIIETLADEFEASLACTGSRYAANTADSCAFILSEKGYVRFASISKTLREAGARIPKGAEIPHASATRAVINGEWFDSAQEISADHWLYDWKHGGIFFEEARYFPRWEQSLTLLVMDEDDRRAATTARTDDGEGLCELNGVLSWPGKRHRR